MMRHPTKFLLEGIDRLGKDTLAKGIQDRAGYHLVLHYSKPVDLAYYASGLPHSPSRQYQEASFRLLFQILLSGSGSRIICNRAHLGEFVYAPLYRRYPGDYVFDLETEYRADTLDDVRLVLLVENFEISTHFQDDGLSLGQASARQHEQALFLEAFERSKFRDKRTICVTDGKSGAFRPHMSILDDVTS